MTPLLTDPGCRLRGAHVGSTSSQYNRLWVNLSSAESTTTWQLCDTAAWKPLVEITWTKVWKWMCDCERKSSSYLLSHYQWMKEYGWLSAQDCGISSALAMEIPQSCSVYSIYIAQLEHDINSLWPGYIISCHRPWLSLVKAITCCRVLFFFANWQFGKKYWQQAIASENQGLWWDINQYWGPFQKRVWALKSKSS